MKKYFVIPLIVLFLLACRALSPQQSPTPISEDPGPTPTNVPAVATPELEATASPQQPPTAISEDTSPTSAPDVPTPELEATAFAANPDFTLVRIYPKDGDLQTQLAAQAKKAAALGQTPFLEFDATWCPPCQAITASLAVKNPLMMKAYRGVYLIHVDTDVWGWGNTDAGFPVDGIPAFFGLDSDGKADGTTTSGAAWGKDIPENISPVLDKFFHP